MEALRRLALSSLSRGTGVIAPWVVGSVRRELEESVATARVIWATASAGSACPKGFAVLPGDLDGGRRAGEWDAPPPVRRGFVADSGDDAFDW